MSKQEFITIAESISKLSSAPQKHGAIIVSGGKIIASGFNTGEYSGKKLLKMYGPISTSETLHAEASALLSLISTKREYWVLREKCGQHEGEKIKDGLVCCSQ